MSNDELLNVKQKQGGPEMPWTKRALEIFSIKDFYQHTCGKCNKMESNEQLLFREGDMSPLLLM
jgi:hypothetical protein